MRYVRPVVAALLLASTSAACSYTETTPRYQAYRSDASYPSGYYYAAAPAPQSSGYYSGGNYYPPATAYPNPNPYATSDNYYASKWDYYRNYQGIHGGPERN